MIPFLAFIYFVGYFMCLIFAFKVSKRETRFWDYMFARSLKNMRARSYTLSFLIGDAFNYQKYEDVCRTCDAFAIRNDELWIHFNEKIVASARKVGRPDLIQKFTARTGDSSQMS